MNNIAYIVTLVSIIGTVANSFQKRWCFYIWLCTNAFWCIYNIINKQYAQALLYLFNFIMAIIGLVKWKAKEIKIAPPKEVFMCSSCAKKLSTADKCTVQYPVREKAECYNCKQYKSGCICKIEK